MRLPTRAPARPVSPARGLFALSLALLATLGAASPRAASASHYIVDPFGGGDFTTIQAALDAQTTVLRDSILVKPKAYDEALNVPALPQEQYLVALGGTYAISTRSIAVSTSGRTTHIEGFTFTGDVLSGGGAQRSTFARCVFQAKVSGLGNAGSSNFADCDFYGRTEFTGYTYGFSLPFHDLRFHGAPLCVWTNGQEGPIGFRSCSFEGPVDTLVRAVINVDRIWFENCRFASGRVGIAYQVTPSSDIAIVTRCTFTDLSEQGIRLEQLGEWSGITATDCRFERCGTGLRWLGLGELGSGPVTLERDTVLSSTYDGIVLGREMSGHILDTVVDGSAGHGILFVAGAGGQQGVFQAKVTNSTLSHNGGDGLRIEGTPIVAPYIYMYSLVTLTNCAVAYNGGAGMEARHVRLDAKGNVFLANGAGGLVTDSLIAWWPSRIVSNTSVLNEGDGFRIAAAAQPQDSLLLMQRNLAVMNASAGLRVPHFSFGSLAFNDAYQNYMGQYVGPASPADSNLTVDPLFCDPTDGVNGLALMQGSPCGHSGVYGAIGALSEGCSNVTAVAPPTAGPLAFAVRPSIARGSVEFVAPTGTGEGRVEVFDLAGRVVWRTSLGGATATVRWNGDGERGRTRAGLYWVRFTRGAERATQRLVWLE